MRVCVCVRVRVSIHRGTRTRTQAHTRYEKLTVPSRELAHELISSAPPSISPVLRQAVVFCLVDLYRALGEDLSPHLDAGLSNSQLKLVTIYINRLQA